MYGYESLSRTDARKAEQIDLESGETLYPGLGYGENELRWAFIRKVYGILAVQLLLTTVVSAFVVSSPSIIDLLRGNSGLLLFFCLVPLILVWPLHVYHQKHPLNFIILGAFTVFLSLTVGVSCANTDGRIVLEALILTAAVVTSLTGYTFWASKNGKDFNYLGPILFTSLVILVLTSLIQMFFPLGPTTTAIYGAISALVFCVFIVYDTNNLIKRFTYDDYILASATLYLDILNLFISIMRVLRSGDS
ncbi:hypothetical protein ES332_A02G053900v1 [Gossypium tomentosum]|uniref:BI1-like protein n=1 Tax=Gossypium tomentosum TaxID=34277 RepID=A0A5D2RDC7_GOSTO|nr:hypothetical protein ES332_A02G053900v1 [Gossypium tomentosum]